MQILDTIQAVTQPEPAIIALEGEIDLHESPNVRATLRPLIEGKAPRIYIDMAEVTYIDSSGLAVLIETMQRTGAYGGKFALFGLRDGVRGIFEIARLDQIFKIFPDETSACADV